MQNSFPKPNPGKQIDLKIGSETWQRFPIKTPVIQPDSDLISDIQKSTQGILKEDDLIIIAESVVAIIQGRAFKFDEIKPSKLAIFLTHFVRKVPYGIGLGKPETMHLAIQECGAPRILFAAVIGGAGKLIGVRGLFYKLAGTQAALIDGPCSYTLPPYNKFATLGPKNPQKTAKQLSQKLNHPVAIVDANDIGTNCIGAFPVKLGNHKTKALTEKLTSDNPSGQSCEQTPVILARQK